MVGHVNDVIVERLEGADIQNFCKQVLLGPEQGWGDYIMRVLTIGPSGYSRNHQHSWLQVNYVIAGEGILVLDEKRQPVSQGSYVLIPGGVSHQFINQGDQGDLVLLGIVSIEAQGK